MRIGQFIQCIDVTAGGTSTAFLNMLAALRTRPRLNLHAYCTPPVDGDPSAAEVARRPNDFTCVKGYGRAIGPGPLGRAVVADVEARKFDLLHLHGLWSPDLMAAALACARMGIPYVWEPHGMLIREAYAQKRWKKELFMSLGMRRALRGSAALLFVTTEERDHSRVPSGIHRQKQHVIPLPVQMPGFTPDQAYRLRARTRFELPPAAPCVVFMGRLHPVKRVELAIRAASIAAKQLPDLHLLLIGGGDEPYVQSLRQLANDSPMKGRIHFAGWVQGDDKWLALAAGDALTLNSVHENFGFVAVEALCVGTMPVLTDNLALADELKRGGVAIIAQGTETTLAAAWVEALHANRAAPIGDRGRAWVAANLSTAAVGERLETLYDSILADGRGASR